MTSGMIDRANSEEHDGVSLHLSHSSHVGADSERVGILLQQQAHLLLRQRSLLRHRRFVTLPRHLRVC